MGHLRVETALPQDEAIRDLTAASIQFRGYQLGTGTIEEQRVSLISRHDPSITFTNSTTSVMKPYISGDRLIPESGIFLSQPAMGSQGIRGWLKDGIISPYSSYFISYGVLYPHNKLLEAVTNLSDLALQAWGLTPEDLRLHYHADDAILEDALSAAVGSIMVVSENSSIMPFRHSYGMPDVTGKNTNLQILVNEGTYRDIGNLTLILNGEQPLAWEVSFDSSPVVAAMANRAHVIAATPMAACITKFNEGSMTHEELVAVDCLNVCTALALEGMQPRSRGASGIMRKFFKTYVSTMQLVGHTLPETRSAAEENIIIESESRRHLSPELAPSTYPMTAKETFDTWLIKLWDSNGV
jgi:hypothetical protein